MSSQALVRYRTNDYSVPDSPVRAALPILRELVGLTQHVSAQIDSRLAGAGMLVMRASASRAVASRSSGSGSDGAAVTALFRHHPDTLILAR